MKSLLLALSLLLGVVSSAQAAGPNGSKSSTPPLRYDFFPLNFALHYERDSSQQMVDRRPLNLAFGVRKGPSTVIFEYSNFAETTGNATLSIDRSHTEYLFWLKQNIMNLEMFDLFISGGVGAYQEKVVTYLSGSGSAEDVGSLQIMGGGSAGVQSMLFKYVLISFEGRLMIGKNLDPNPQPGMVLRLGFEF